ncbi:putative lipolytic enzyme [Advenella mimigardefordensis DPN7]|uniref:Putative lipolytic enzyme n=1 Tax=Advenella mimigardefordensis (strain DSM 17166 / LMG 22922 / DPN7) TaxID=1247726 RepID=W0PI03_ADVMD|nr:putative lipolytic enzyme [Advenella mimigardefordensis DPN7]
MSLRTGFYLLLTACLSLNAFTVQARQWVASWQASPQPVWTQDFAFPTGIPQMIQDTTFIQNVMISRGGERLRLVLSNRYGTSPLTVEQTTVSRRKGPAGWMGTPTTITFNGRPAVTIAPGQQLVSDPLNMPVADLQQLQIAHYVNAQTALETFHWDGRQQAVFSKGNQTQSPMSAAKNLLQRTQARVFLSRIDTESATSGCAVAVLGDSITDGNGVPIDSNTRVTDYMADRLRASSMGVINAGISGARLLGDKMGEHALARLPQDVIDAPGVTTLVLFIGINDISWPGTAFAPKQSMPGLGSLQTEYRKVVAFAKSKGLRVIGVTLTPFRGALAGTPLDNYYNDQKDHLRVAVNAWIRGAGVFDAVIDADRLLQDPQDITKLDARYDSGDHLHPGPAGNAVLAQAIAGQIRACQ